MLRACSRTLVFASTIEEVPAALDLARVKVSVDALLGALGMRILATLKDMAVQAQNEENGGGKMVVKSKESTSKTQSDHDSSLQYICHGKSIFDYVNSVLRPKLLLFATRDRILREVALARATTLRDATLSSRAMDSQHETIIAIVKHSPGYNLGLQS